MSIPKWKKDKIIETISKINEIIKRGRDEKDTICGCDLSACKKVSLYLETWAKAPLEDVLEERR